MDLDEVRQKLQDGELVQSEYPREFTISLGPATRAPETGDIWLLADSPYVVSDIECNRVTCTGTIRYLKEADPPQTGGD